MNAPAEAFRCQSLAKEIAAELRAKVRSESSMLAGQRVLITKFDHDPSRAVGSARHKRCSWPIGARQEQWLRAYPQATAAQAATLAPRPPFNARVETVTTKPFFREPFTPNGGLVVQSCARSLRHREAIISLAARYKLPRSTALGTMLARAVCCHMGLKPNRPLTRRRLLRRPHP